MTRDATTREAWSSPTGFLLASIGSAVGIGNLWRFPYVVGTTFFLLMFFAALTSAVSILEVPVATLIDVWGMPRRRAASVATAVVLLLGLPSALSYTALRLELFGVPLLDLKDFAFGTVGMTLGALVLSVAAGWFAREKLLPGALMVIVKVVVPLALVASLIARLLDRG